MKHTLILNNLNCAHCASKIEQKVAQTEGYSNVSFNFATKKLCFEHDGKDLIPEIQKICDSIEDGVKVSGEQNRSREHKHDHGEHCDCHDHEHSHEHGHEHGERGHFKTVLLIAAIILGVSALALHLLSEGETAHWTVFGLSLTATLAAGWDVFLKGFKNALRLRIEETVLITVAVIAAFFLGEYVEAAMVTILFSIGEYVEDLAVGKSRRDIEKLSQIRPDTATVLENGEEHLHRAEEVAVGTLIVVKPHERVPLDRAFPPAAKLPAAR